MSNKHLLQQIEKLKEQLIGLLIAWYDMQTQTLPKILYQYESLFGNIENEIAKKEIEADTIELKYQLLLCSADAEKQDFDKSNTLVEELIQQACARYNEKKQQKLKAISITPNKSRLLDTTLNDQFDLSNIYRQIVKKLHPDVVGNNIKLQTCWNSVQYCYNNNDIQHLQMFYFVLCENYITNEINEQILHNKVDILTEYIHQQTNENKDLSLQVPFCFEHKFNDKQWIITKTNDLRKKLMELNKKIMHNERLLKQILFKKK